ncbi:MAG: GNAT family N-acetyltransferase [Puia sp.]|nr:GNAT family N-acetyltransferase [Puia sp.]
MPSNEPIQPPPSGDSEPEYRIVRLTTGGLKDLEELHKAVYGISSPQDYFTKKYDTAYTGVSWLGYLAYNGLGIAVAYYGVIPCFMEYRAQVVLAAQSGDTMTHPGYRYKGMFVELSRITFALCRENGVKFLFGFPNQHSYHGAIRLGWIPTETMRCFLLPVRSFPWYGLSNRFGGWLKDIYRSYAEWVLRKYALPLRGIPNLAKNEGYGGLSRDERYFDYKRYGKSSVIGIDGSRAWIAIKTGLVIGDLVVEEQHFDSTLRSLKKIAAKLGLRQVSFHTSPGTFLHGLFAARYPSIASFPVLFQDLGTTIPFDRLKFTFADIDIF